jgi:predicted Zn-dependent peptidase
MKISLFSYLFLFLFFSLTANAQLKVVEPKSNVNRPNAGPNDVMELVLKNGLKVYLNEDHTQKDVLGAVVVRGGAKMDAPDATGTAHYFEHMMFKGTKTLGTIDYNSERPYLDSIRQMYDLLRLDRTDAAFRKKVLKKIDNYSVEAAKYAIPNEFDNIVAELGGTRVNAYTTYENIVYHNHFPKQSMEQWIELYRDRFEAPVFRLFQSELETVYEEKNMSMDNFFRSIYEEVYRNFYPKSVYGRHTVLGTIEDLKNPSISAMETYWKEYYNANNMALVLIGDFNIQDVLPVLEEKFGTWRDGQKANMPAAVEDPFDGDVVVKKKLAPIPLGILGFRAVKVGDEDELALDVLAQMLTNSSSTGLIDTLTISQDLMGAQVFQDKHYDKGGLFVFYAPKPIIQSVGNAKKKVMAQLQKLKSGNFSDELLKGVITSMRKEELSSLENSEYKLRKIIDTYMSEGRWDDVLAYNESLNQISKLDIIRVANKYLGDNYLDFQSKIGFPKKTKLAKPDITPLDPVNKDAESMEASIIRQMETQNIEPTFIDFANDISISDLRNNLHFFIVKNPINSIFSANIRVGVGNLENNKLEQLAYYLNNCGTELQTYADFSSMLQKEGTNIYFSADNDYFNIFIDGFEENMPLAIDHLAMLLNMPRDDKKINKKFLRDQKMEIKLLKKDVGSQIQLVDEFSLYGSQSVALNKASKSEIKGLSIQDYKKMISELFKVETYVHYVGNSSEEEVKQKIGTALPFSPNLQRSKSPFTRPLPELKKDKLYFLENSNAIQTHIRVETPSKAIDEDGRAYVQAFNNYFGSGMNSLLFREVREYRALAYGAWGYFSLPYRFDEPGYLKIGMSTQADKTNEAIELLLNLVDSMPQQEKRIEGLKKYLMLSFNAKMPDFRYRSYIVQKWMFQGYKSDPRKNIYAKYEDLSMNDIVKFYDANILGRKRIISIVGDSKRFDLEKIKANKDFRKLKLKDVLKY